MIASLIITDTETQGLDPAKHAAIEVAVAVWSVPHRTMTACYSTLIRADGNEAEAINRIPAVALGFAAPPEYAWRAVGAFIEKAHKASAFVAHRASFDRSFYPKELANSREWICSKYDIEWPRSKPGASLVEVALAHDVAIAVNHRALADVLLLCRVFERCAELGYDIDAMIARAMRPKATFVSLAPFEEKEAVKAAGFSWIPDRKVWERTMAIEDAAKLPFKVREI